MIRFGIKPWEIEFDNVKDIFLTAEKLGFEVGWIADHLHEDFVIPAQPQLEIFFPSLRTLTPPDFRS